MTFQCSETSNPMDIFWACSTCCLVFRGASCCISLHFGKHSTGWISRWWVKSVWLLCSLLEKENHTHVIIGLAIFRNKQKIMHTFFRTPKTWKTLRHIDRFPNSAIFSTYRQFVACCCLPFPANVAYSFYHFVNFF